MILVLTPIIR